MSNEKSEKPAYGQQPQSQPAKFVKTIQVDQEIERIVETRIRTAFIFCLAELEEKLGHTWGENEDDGKELTAEQSANLELFESWRKSIMDFGHKQIRIAKAEVRKTLYTEKE